MAKDVEARSPEDVAGEPAGLSLSEWLWHTLQSVRTTIYVLPAIAVAATIGALIPQGRPVEYYLMLYGRQRGGLVTTLGFDHLYGSTWFLILLAILLANLVACVGRSFRRAALEYRGPTAAALARKLQGGRAVSCWFGKSAAPGLEAKLTETLRRAHCALHVEDGPDGARRLLVRRWSFASYGRIVTHLAIFLIALGAVLGVLPWTSVDESVTVTEGETWRDTKGKIGFDVRLDHFRMDFYPTTGAPSHYASDLTLFAGGGEVRKGTATVNKSLVEKGVALGQASWGLAGVRLTVSDRSGATETAQLALVPVTDDQGHSSWLPDRNGSPAFLRDGTWALTADDFWPESIERDGKVMGAPAEYPRNPAISLVAVSGLREGRHDFHSLGWVRRGRTVTYEGRTVRFDDLVYTSTLSARRDLGLPLVWAGFILTTLGMIVMFYIRPRAFLVELTPAGKGDRTRIAVAPSGRELFESDRHLVEKAAEAELTPGGPSG